SIATIGAIAPALIFLRPAPPPGLLPCVLIPLRRTGPSRCDTTREHLGLYARSRAQTGRRKARRRADDQRPGARRPAALGCGAPPRAHRARRSLRGRPPRRFR